MRVLDSETRKAVEAFILDHYQAMTSNTIAEHFGISISTVRHVVSAMQEEATDEQRVLLTKKRFKGQGHRILDESRREIPIEYPDVPWHMRLTHRNQSLGPVRESWWNENGEAM